MRLIDADAIITALLYDEEHEETQEAKMSIADFLDSHTIEGCPQNDGWISVKDRMPPPGKELLVARKYKEPGKKEIRYVEIGELMDDCTWLSDGDEYKINRKYHSRPYAWMLLSEPPKEKNDD